MKDFLTKSIDLSSETYAVQGLYVIVYFLTLIVLLQSLSMIYFLFKDVKQKQRIKELEDTYIDFRH